NWSFTVPSYFNGGIRVVAISVSDAAMGTAQTALASKGAFIVTPNMPLFVAPNDTFTATATITNNVKGSGKDAKLELKIENSAGLKIIDAPKDIALAEGAEATIPVKIQATEELGSAELKFTAKLGNAQFVRSETLSVRPPMPAMTTLVSGFSKDMSVTLNDIRKLYPQFAESNAAVSTMPISLIGGLRDYLATYPYGCNEQITSQTFPNVILYGNTELINAFGWKSEQMEKVVNSTFSQLRERQNANGGFGMWNYYSEPHGFISSYVMHFLLEAKTKNLAVPEDVFDNNMRYLKQFANEAPTSLETAREKAYAIYLLTRTGEITSNYIPHLTDYLDNYYKDSWHNDLAAVYLAATYQLMNMSPEASQLLDIFQLEEPVTYKNNYNLYPFYDSLTRYSQYVYIIAEHFPNRLAKIDKKVIYRVANFVGEGSYNTVSSSYAVMALNSYVKASMGDIANINITATALDGVKKALVATGERLKVAKISEPLSALEFLSDKPQFFYQLASSGYDKTLPEKPLVEGLELDRKYLDKNGKPVSKVKLSDIVTVVLTLRSGNNDTKGNIAIVDLLPGGFEIEPEAKQNIDKKVKNEQSDGEEAETEEVAKSEAVQEKINEWSPSSKDAREDRMILYGDFISEKRIYTYHIKATSRGNFITPPYYAESMYERKLKTRGVVGKIEVE
ncbi:MAG: alpha-2-macroglobulin family protein, partial [Pseudomonadota bacterium]